MSIAVQRVFELESATENKAARGNPRRIGLMGIPSWLTYLGYPLQRAVPREMLFMHPSLTPRRN